MSYSWSKFGREAEYVVALYLKSIGWPDVLLSPGSRGPADIIASCPTALWLIQVKASSGIPRLKAREVRRLMALARKRKGVPVISTLQPISTAAFLTGNFGINFYELEGWSALNPIEVLGNRDSAALKSKARFP